PRPAPWGSMGPLPRERRPAMPTVASLVCLLTAAPALVAQAHPAPDFQALGRTLTAQFASGELAPVWAAFTPAMQRHMSPEALRAYQAKVGREVGRETALVHEQVYVAYHF